jgi:16S rRNA A1518/A1519 N6-dimethyltransferase RsmA/KsgA/DIM1 with predicted DNA glycosylase/AP lyase activity
VRDITLVPFLLFLDITQYIFLNPPYNLTSSLYFKAYKNGYKELAFIILFLLLILYIPFLGIVFIFTLI